jgi:hypothetical protein
MLLARYYSHSYECYGMHVPVNIFQTALRSLRSSVGETARDFLPTSLGDRFVVDKTLQSRSHIARLEQDISWLKDTAAASALTGFVLDFGSGDELETRITATTLGAQEVIAIDPRLINDELGRTKSIRSYRDISDSTEELPRCDLVLLRHVLHHLSADSQEMTLARIAEQGSGDAFVCVVEDCVDAVGYYPVCDECGSVQNAWNTCTGEERRKCLEINDLWSNCVAYARRPSDQWHSFRTESDWVGLLSRLGYVIEESQRFPFAHTRLHGVPKLLLLARKEQAT